MIQQALGRFGHIDILVNNAGSRPGPDRVPVVELGEAAWDQVQNVNAVCPGTTLTERTGYIAAALNEQDAPAHDATQTMVGSLAEKTPLGRIAEPEDVARTVAFLASAESDYTTGVALLVAGGIQM